MEMVSVLEMSLLLIPLAVSGKSVILFLEMRRKSRLCIKQYVRDMKIPFKSKIIIWGGMCADSECAGVICQ